MSSFILLMEGGPEGREGIASCTKSVRITGNSIPSPLLGLVRNALQFLAHNTLQKTLGQIDGAYVKKH